MLNDQDMQDTYTTAVRIFAHVSDSCTDDNVIVVHGNARWDAVAAWLLAFTMGHGHSVTLMDSTGNILAHRVAAVSTTMH